jgi:Na+/melibiose symporter-like transporter
MKILGFEVPSMIMKLCKPAQLYLVLSLISVIFYLVSMLNVHDTVLEAEPEGGGVHHYTLGGLLVKIIFTILWIYILNYICQFKYGKKIAWFIVLLPFFFMGLMLVGLLCAVSFIALQTKKTKNLQNELSVEKMKVKEDVVSEPTMK